MLLKSKSKLPFRFFLPLLLSSFIPHLVYAGCCVISCDPVLSSAYRYQDKEVGKAFDAFIRNLRKVAREERKNARKIDDYNKVLTAYLEREKLDYVREKDDYHKAVKKRKIYEVLFAAQIVKSEVRK